MEFDVIKDLSKLEGTAYFEFLPGKYNNKCWNENSIFLDEDSMSLIEEVFVRNVKHYDHYSFSEIKKEELPLVVAELENIISDLESNRLINGTLFSYEYYQALNEQIYINKEVVIGLIREIIQWLKATMEKEEIISILGL